MRSNPYIPGIPEHLKKFQKNFQKGLSIQKSFRYILQLRKTADITKVLSESNPRGSSLYIHLPLDLGQERATPFDIGQEVKKVRHQICSGKAGRKP